jgi:class 3 adenylate cyclase
MFEVAVYNPRQHKQFRRESGSLVLARAGQADALWTTVEGSEPESDARVEFLLQHEGVSLALPGCDATDYDSHAAHDAAIRFTIGDTRFEVAFVGSGEHERRPLQPLRSDEYNVRSRKLTAWGPSPGTLSRWFAALSSLNHWAMSLQELYVQAARCAVEAIGLDGGIVLRLRDGEWEIATSFLPHPELDIHYDRAALDELRSSPQTWFHGSADGSESNTAAVVVSPLQNAAGALMGAVYGYRSVREGNARRSIRYLEANMIELLAAAVSEGIARIEHAAETDRRRVLLEQAAAASQNQSSREIVTDEREVTLLFADLRNSTELAASVQPNEMYELMSQVMESLTAAVIDHDGLVIDYYGDGLAAMWNAPADQREHPELGCRAGLRMLQSVRAVASDWADFLDRELQIGIGIHTGVTHVGNTGTRHRVKYGPRGTAVNLASRVEATTKQLEVPLLVTSATAKHLSSRFTTHRICRAQMRGFDQAVDLYGVVPAAADEPATMAWQTYQQAVRHFEEGRLQEAAQQLATIDRAIRDVPSRFLLEHIQRELAQQNRRRSTDKENNSPGGVIVLNAK